MPGENTIRKRFLPGMLMLLLVVFALSGCGRMTDTSGLSGRWVLVRGDSDGVLLPESLIKDNRLTLRLDPDGSGVLGENTSQGRILWNYEDGKIFLQAGDAALSGTVEGNELLLQGEEETRLHFVRDTQEEAAEEKTALPAEAFSGGWYGWWKIEDSKGEMPVSWYDCCAVFEAQEDGTVLLTLWDEDGSRAEPLSQVRFITEEEGTLVSVSGYFAFMEIQGGQWRLTEPDPAILIPDIMHEAEGESFRATVYMRRWGEDWNDTPEEQRPFYYEDWYLPLLKEKAELPDQIPWQSLEARRERAEEAQAAPPDRS